MGTVRPFSDTPSSRGFEHPELRTEPSDMSVKRFPLGALGGPMRRSGETPRHIEALGRQSWGAFLGVSINGGTPKWISVSPVKLDDLDGL